jgi:hypothetical protein
MGTDVHEDEDGSGAGLMTSSRWGKYQRRGAFCWTSPGKEAPDENDQGAGHIPRDSSRADAAPFNSLDAICGWAASLGYEGNQIPSWDARLFDLNRASRVPGLRRRGEGDRGRTWPIHHRTLDPSPGPARRRSSGL